jgi:hypothetical protein
MTTMIGGQIGGRMQKILIKGCRNAKYFALETSGYKIPWIVRPGANTELSHVPSHPSLAFAWPDDREPNKIQGILIKRVKMQKILHLRPPNTKDFDRGCRLIIANQIQKILYLTKDFWSCVCVESKRFWSRLSKSKKILYLKQPKSIAFASHTPKILCVCADF